MLAAAARVLALLVFAVLLVEAGATWAQYARRRELRRWLQARRRPFDDAARSV